MLKEENTQLKELLYRTFDEVNTALLVCGIYRVF